VEKGKTVTIQWLFAGQSVQPLTAAADASGVGSEHLSNILKTIKMVFWEGNRGPHGNLGLQEFSAPGWACTT
jgi:hypothetical protein